MISCWDIWGISINCVENFYWRLRLPSSGCWGYSWKGLLSNWVFLDLYLPYFQFYWLLVRTRNSVTVSLSHVRSSQFRCLGVQTSSISKDGLLIRVVLFSIFMDAALINFCSSFDCFLPPESVFGALVFLSSKNVQTHGCRFCRSHKEFRNCNFQLFDSGPQGSPLLNFTQLYPWSWMLL